MSEVCWKVAGGCKLRLLSPRETFACEGARFYTSGKLFVG
jgi:hypothetical protein